jgi:5'-nucleotidase
MEMDRMNTGRFKKFVILHSNDMHGDFLAEAQGAPGELIGGLALLSGYINKVRREEKHVLYTISGDMLQGSLIDVDSRGVSTIEIMNYLAPDVVTLGNHELDYGLPHLLFLEKMANFPIVNANLHIKKYHKRLMQPYVIMHVDGFDILFIGIITEDVLHQLRLDSDIATFVGVEDAGAEIGKICNAYKNEDIDLTILLTHIGFEADKRLAALLKPEWGVDLILGGHSHTVLEQPVEVNGILITQAGVGTDQIGRFDIVVDDETNSIVGWKWELVPIRAGVAEPDAGLQEFIDSYQEKLDSHNQTIISHLTRKLTHPGRDRETELGNLFADILAQCTHADVALVISGSLRAPTLGPPITLGDLKCVFPYDGPVYKVTLTGAQLKQIFRFNLAPIERRRRILQVSRSVRVVYDDKRRDLASLTIHGVPVEDEAHYTLCLQEYYYKNAPVRLGLSIEELNAVAPARVVTTSSQDVIEEHLRIHQKLTSQVEGRIIIQS